jgi:hypothetical protein
MAPPGTQACSFDIAKFHRTCPIVPDHKPWLVVQGHPGQFWIDHCNPFGLGSASSNAGMIGNAAVDIWIKEGIAPICKYEDDLEVFRFPVKNGPYKDGNFEFMYDKVECLSRIHRLNIPWHPDKCDPAFMFVSDYIGFRWDIPQRSVALPPIKRLKFLERVRIFLDRFSGHRCQLIDVDRIHGSLCHVAFVYLEGRSRLPSLSNFSATFKGNEYIRRYPPASVISDLRWWQNALLQEDVSRKLLSRGPIKDLGIFVDASTSWGIGIIIDGHWAAFKLADNWKSPGQDICWLETVAMEILVYFLEQLNFSNVQLRIHSDNQGAIGALSKGRSPNRAINLAVRRTFAILYPLFITPELVFVESENNPADALSRGRLGATDKRLIQSFTLPDDLVHVLFNV